MPIFSVDMHPDTDPLLLATAGTDAETRVRFLARHALFARKRALTRPPLSLSRCLPLARSGQVWLVPSPKQGDEDCEPPEFLFALGGHDQAVNCVRWSPHGDAIASAGDGGVVTVWSAPAGDAAAPPPPAGASGASADDAALLALLFGGEKPARRPGTAAAAPRDHAAAWFALLMDALARNVQVRAPARVPRSLSRSLPRSSESPRSPRAL